MVIDFKEIPLANKGGGNQDRFEQFAIDFLETIGFKIIRRPDRGADGKKDGIVSETRKGIEGETTVKWLVSCKHYAHSGSAVKDIDELDIKDRVFRHQCNGFIGVYSTLPLSTLTNKLDGLKGIEYTIYDNSRIERELLLSNQRDRLLVSYFPLSHNKYKKQTFHENVQYDEDVTIIRPQLTEEDVMRITKTAIIILDIEKIKEEYYGSVFNEKDHPLRKLYRYSDHTNEKVATAIFNFLQSVANQTNDSEIAATLYSLILTFFPSSYETDEKDRIENGKQCILIGFSLVYDALIKINNFRIASYGLLIFKFIHQEGIRNDMPLLTNEVKHQYSELERTLERPERPDLEQAKKLVKTFKDNINTWGLNLPDMDEGLYQLIQKGDKNKNLSIT